MVWSLDNMEFLSHFTFHIFHPTGVEHLEDQRQWKWDWNSATTSIGYGMIFATAKINSNRR